MSVPPEALAEIQLSIIKDARTQMEDLLVFVLKDLF